MFSGRLWELFIDSFPKILIPGLTVTIPLTVISFTFALIIAVIMALVQFANVKVLKQIARFYIWIFRGTPLLVQLFVVFFGLSRPKLVDEEMVRSMNADAVIFAMANPEPEILPETAKAAGFYTVGAYEKAYAAQWAELTTLCDETVEDWSQSL